jgi:hypothetical protein
MAIGDLLHKSFLFSAAKSLSALETSYTTIALYFGTLEARTPDEVICVPGKKGRNITVHVHMNDAAKRAKAEGHPCLTYVNLHGAVPSQAHSKYLLALQVVDSFSKDKVGMWGSSSTSCSQTF